MLKVLEARILCNPTEVTEDLMENMKFSMYLCGNMPGYILNYNEMVLHT